jgi:threonine/homoserine/homoserine lactone efflux protein
MVWSFIVAAILIELTPGPNMMWLAVLGATRGRITALAAVAGIALGLTIAATIAGFGLTAFFNQFPGLFQALRWAGALYLLYLAWDAWRDADDKNFDTNDSPAKAFQQGLITNILNPKAYLFYAAVLPQFISNTTSPASDLVTLSAIYITVATIIHAMIAVLAGSAAQWLKTAPMARLIRKALAVLIAIAALWFFYSTQVTQ